MSEPIDIKTKKIIPQIQSQKFDKILVLENLEQNILTHWDTWGKFQQTWTNRAYKTFKDLDKYIVMMYLVLTSGKIFLVNFIIFPWMNFMIWKQLQLKR